MSWFKILHGNIGIKKILFTHEVKDPHMKINFTYGIFISQMELKLLHI